MSRVGEHLAVGGLDSAPRCLERLFHAGVKEVASFSKPAASLIEKSPTLLGLVFRVHSVVALEFMAAMGKLAFPLVRAETFFHELPA